MRIYKNESFLSPCKEYYEKNYGKKYEEINLYLTNRQKKLLKNAPLLSHNICSVQSTKRTGKTSFFNMEKEYKEGFEEEIEIKTDAYGCPIEE